MAVVVVEVLVVLGEVEEVEEVEEEEAGWTLKLESVLVAVMG